MGDMRLQLQTANDEFLQVRHMSKKHPEPEATKRIRNGWFYDLFLCHVLVGALSLPWSLFAD